ncbi:MAG: LD-carboxypeptidase, partial [Myxococcota bacterium]|nr:LD-carboxypeptidase [Myxococcota bacterium]
MIPQHSTIAVVAPSGIFSEERLKKGISLVESWGYNIVLSPNLFEKHLFMAGTSSQRSSDLSAAIDNELIDALWFARGGYGTVETLVRTPLEDCNKPILGFSDATALGCALSNQGKTFVHAPVLHSLEDLCDQTSQEALRRFLTEGKAPKINVSLLRGDPSPRTGGLVGGNLCVISSLMGTPWQLRTHDKIVMLEDVGEPAYKIHRMLNQLKYGKLFSQAKAIVFGEFKSCAIPNPLSFTEVILDALHDIDVPIYIDA